MLTRMYLLGAGLCLCAYARAQTPLPTENALNTTGNTLVAGGITYAYSVGEPIGFSLNSCSFTQGVIQPTTSKDSIIGIEEVFDEKYTAKFYPNPTQDYIIVETDFMNFTRYQITTLDGKLIETGAFQYMPVRLGYLQAGQYYLQLRSEDAATVKTVKLIKQ